MARFSNDVIASCAFGLKVDSHTNEDNEFYAMGKSAATLNTRQFLMIFFSNYFPKLAKVSILKFFIQLVPAVLS